MANINNLKPFNQGYDARRGSKPKGAIHISTYIRNILEDENFEYKLQDGKVMKGAPIEAMIKALAVKASQGDVRAFDLLAKHGYSTRLEVSVQTPVLDLTSEQAEQLLRLRANRAIL